MMNRKFGEKAVGIIFVCCFLLLSGTMAKAEPTRVAIFPFQIHSGEDLEYLQAGLYEMLANRLTSADGDIRVIPREELAQKISTAPAGSLKEKSTISQTLRADYFVSGSLTALGGSISTDVQFYGINQTAPLVKLSQTGGKGDVIAHIDQFAAIINQKVFEKPTVSSGPSDKKAADADASKPIQGLSIVAKKGEDYKGRWQSETYPTQIRGCALGDVDGDGTQEIVTIDQYRINVYQYRENGLKELTRVALGRHANILAVDVADINANGKSEIFVTNFARLSERPASLIYEYTDNSLSILDKDTQWFYRVQQDLDGSSMLTAQTKLINLSASDEIQILSFDGGQYRSEDVIDPPKKANLYDIAYIRDQQSGRQLYVGYDRNSEITAWSDDGQIVWESGEPAGGSLNYIEYSDRQALDKVRHYLSKRILLADTDENGNPEFIAIKNINSSPEWFTKARRYKRGYIACVEWDASDALQTKWKTEEERGYISDMALGDATNDGKVDLVFTVVSDVKIKLEKSSSYLVIQQLP